MAVAGRVGGTIVCANRSLLWFVFLYADESGVSVPIQGVIFREAGLGLVSVSYSSSHPFPLAAYKERHADSNRSCLGLLRNTISIQFLHDPFR